MPTSPGTDRPRGLLSKKCRYCDRRFSKAEHLKRHQRSHTGERPYTCPRCNKSFSRSDVLIRHLKNHPQIVGQEVAKSPSEGDFIQADNRQQQQPLPIPQQSLQNIDPNLPPHLPPIHEQIPQDVHQRQEYIPSPSVIDPALEGPLEDHAQRRPSQSVPSGLDHLAQLASQRKWRHGTMDSAMGDSATAALPEMSGPPTWNMEISNGGHNSHEVGYDARSVQPDPSFQNLGPSPNTASRFGFEQDIYAGRMNGMHDHMTPDMGGIAPDGAIMPQDLQTWFDQFDLDPHLQPGNMAEYDQSQHNGATPIGRRGPSLTSEGQNSLRNPSSPSTLIPNERFAKVEKCWPTRHSNPLRLMPTLWWDAVTKTEDNLFSNSNLSPEAMEQNRQCGSRWGLDEDCRERLQKMFVTINHPTRDSGPAAFGSPENYSTPSDTRSVLQAPSIIGESPITTNFPPAEIFDIGLDLYFRQFHPLMPFIHTPTFCPKTAPTSILFIMCLIGLTILQTKGATAFVRQTFSKALEQVSAELIPASGIEGNRIDQMSTLASAVLILNLTEITGQKSHQAQCQMLYTNVIMTAQKNGLFNANDGQPLTDAFFGQITDLDARWKAWGRIECAKRLIMSLTMVDTWYSAMLHTSPILRTEDIQVILPCDAALFQAPTAQRWAHLASTNHQLTMPYVSLSKDVLTLPELPSSFEPLGMHCILSIIRLRISQDFHRLLSGTSFRAVEHSFVPCLTYESDPFARKTKNLVVQTMKSYQHALSHMNPNCLVLWHNMCIMLTSDARLFETGAGCAGPVAARQALDDIARWTQTASARRACLHAAQTFKLMSNRRASDGDPFHASSGLFLSALILGLYVFMVPPDPEANAVNSTLDLTDEVNWTVVGDEGLVSSNISKKEMSNDAATNFIRNGGGICFDGVVHSPGYEAARRILLDYARLMEDIGRWRVRINQFSRVLRIMSDALVDVDVGMGGQ